MRIYYLYMDYKLKNLRHYHVQLLTYTCVELSVFPRASVQSSLSTAGSLIQSILKEGGENSRPEYSKFSVDEQRRICVMLCTAEYCMETSQQLEEKLKEKTNQTLASAISLSQEQDVFHGFD